MRQMDSEKYTITPNSFKYSFTGAKAKDCIEFTGFPQLITRNLNDWAKDWRQVMNRKEADGTKNSKYV